MSMKLKPNFIPRSLCTSILAKFFFCIDSLIISVYSVTYKCLSLVLGVLQNILMLIATQARGFLF